MVTKYTFFVRIIQLNNLHYSHMASMNERIMIVNNKPLLYFSIVQYYRSVTEVQKNIRRKRQSFCELHNKKF